VLNSPNFLFTEPSLTRSCGFTKGPQPTPQPTPYVPASQQSTQIDGADRSVNVASNQRGKQMPKKKKIAIIVGTIVPAVVITAVILMVVFLRTEVFVIQSANTKQDWMDAMAIAFNEKRKPITSDIYEKGAYSNEIC
jgi:hypothetical protein